MTTSMTQDLAAQLQGAPVQQIAQQIGVDPAAAQNAVSTALPLLMGALGRNASQPDGAQALFGALQKDHAGSGGLGDVLGAVLGGGQGNGAGILEHIFGGQQPRAEQAIGQSAGIGQDKAAALLRLLAPIVLAYLAKRMFENRQTPAGTPASTEPASPPATPQPSSTGGQPEAQAPSAGVLGDILGEEARKFEEQAGPLGGVLGKVLDRDGDGDTDFSDLLKIGGAILGGQRKA